jgi:IS1 family transposase
VYQLSREEALSVLHLLVEGNSLRSIQRLTGVHRDTIARLMLRVGTQLREFLDGRMRNLTLNHIQCDEIWTFVRKKQARLTDAERDNPALGDQYLFIALDEDTKLVPTFAIGKRTTETTELFMDDLAGRIVVPSLLEPGDRPMISTDGWQAYPNAVDGAFGGSVRYGVIIKDYQQTEQPGRYGPPEMTGAVRRVIQGNINRFDICTSHVERHNLTIRTFLKRFTRLALGFSKKLDNLAAATALYVAHYNYCRIHGSLRMTPAMQARIAGHPWTLEELLEAAETA